MASVSVLAHDADKLSRPAVCAKTGAIATTTIPMTAVHVPGWIWILVLFGIFPLLIAYFATRKTIGILVPASDEAAQNRRRASLTMIAALAVSLLVAGAGVVFAKPSVSWIGIGGLVVAVMAYPFHLRGWIDARFDGEMIQLNRVHPEYAQAVEL